MLLFFALGLPEVAAQGNPFELSTPTQISIPAITPAEILPGANSETVATVSQMGLPSPLNTQVQRTLTGVWRMRLRPNENPNDLNITYELEALNGRANRLSHPNDTQAEMQVLMQSLPPNIVSRGNGVTDVEGRLQLQLDLSKARLAGDYHGTLRITVNRL